MNLAHANLLWLLLVIPPALVVFFWWAMRVRQRLLTQFVEARLLAQLTAGISPLRRKIRFAFLIFAAALLIISMAGPRFGYDLEEVEQRGLDIVVAVDTSKSMLATDIPPNRLTRAKLAALELMQVAKADRLGLVAFAGDAFLECPLTIDNTAFQQSLQALDVNSIPQGGTAIAAAIETALKTFKEKNHHKALVLFTDGEDNDEGALAAAQTAAEAGLKIFTIGIGSAEGTLVQVGDEKGNSDYIRDEKGQVVKTKLNEALLQQIATTADGFYLPLRGADTMNTLYERGLAALPKSEGKGQVVQRFHERFHWPLALAIVLVVVEFLLPDRRTPNRATQKTAVAILLTFCGFSNLVSASPTSALHDFQSGNFTNAWVEYERLAQIQTNDLRLIFNAGDAAYRATNFDRAEKLFQQVTLSPDLNLQQQAFYNLGNVQFQQAKQAKDLDGLQTGFETSEKTYARAVTLNTNDVDAKFNLAFTQSAIEQIKQLREALQRARADADTAVREHNYHRALEIMERLMQNKIAAKQFEDFTKKLKDIDAITTPGQP